MKSENWARPGFFKCLEVQEGRDVTVDMLYDVPTALSVLRENVRDEDIDEAMKIQALEQDIRVFVGRLS